jgi:hypothetical protein
VTSSDSVFITGGAEVGFTVAGSSKGVAVPNVIGATQSSAELQVTELGLVARPQDAACATGSADNSIVTEIPPADTEAETRIRCDAARQRQLLRRFFLAYERARRIAPGRTTTRSPSEGAIGNGTPPS